MPVGAPPPSVGGQPRKATSPLVWILGIVAALFVLAGLAVVGAGLFVAHKVKQAGFDPDLMRKNPGLAITKMATMNNPDVQVLSVDEGKGRITLKDNKTGKVVTMNFEDVKQGKISFQEEGQAAVTLETHGQGASGGMEVKSAEGSMKFGGGPADIPDWVPGYPGTKPEANFSMQGKDGTAGSVHFVTKDPIKNVMSYYEDKLKQAGFNVNLTTTGPQGGVVSADDAARKRNVMVMLGTEQGGTTVNVTFSAKP